MGLPGGSPTAVSRHLAQSLTAAGGFGLGLSGVATGVMGEPRWKRPLQGGLISFANEAWGQNNLKADWCSLERGLPSESARSSRCCRLDFPFHISSPVYSLVLGRLCLRGNWGLVGCKQVSNITEIF